MKTPITKAVDLLRKWPLIMEKVEQIRKKGFQVIQNGDHTIIKPHQGISVKGFKKIEVLESGSYESVVKAVTLYNEWEAEAYKA